MNAGRTTALAALTASSLLLVACGAGPGQDVPDLGDAVAEVSPPATSVAGEVIDLPDSFAEVSDMEAAGDVLGLRARTVLALGTLEQLRSGDATEVEIPETCGDLTASADTFVLACGEEVLLIDAGDGGVEKRTVETSATAAALTSSGELVVGSGEENKVLVYDAEGAEVESITVAGPSSQILAVPVAGEDDAVVRTDHASTTIQDVHWRDGDQGGTLRVGLGIGRAAAGTDGIVLASDNRGDQLAVYTATGVVRLHQTVPVDDSPWGVAWDADRNLAWVASTGTNTLVGHTLATGVPEATVTLDTVADGQNILVLADGTLLVASATGGGLQIITDPENA